MDRRMSEDTIQNVPTHNSLKGRPSYPLGQDEATTAPLTPAEQLVANKLRRKIDIRILPVVFVVYIMNFVDRTNYASARLQGLEEDLSLTETEYQAGLSAFYVGYMIGQVPSNMTLAWFGRPSMHMAIVTCAWGTVSALTALVRGFSGLLACRLVLGFVEAPFFPGVMFALSKWYTRDELAFRMAIFFSGNLFAGAFGHLLAAGILGGIGHALGLTPWQWLYIIEGAITVTLGLALYFVLPDFPETWKSLSQEEYEVATRRLAAEATEADVDKAGFGAQIKGLKLALTDVKTYLFAVAQMLVLACGGLLNYFPSITATLGYSHFTTLLLCAPPHIFAIVWILIHAWLSDKLKTRFWFFIYPAPLIIVSFVLLLTTNSVGPRYFSLFLVQGQNLMGSTTFAWISSSIPRPPAKRAAAIAIVNSCASLASVWTPFIYFGPKYELAMEVNIGLAVLASILAVALRFVLVKSNEELARIEDTNIALSEKDLAKVQKIAGVEGVSIDTARKMHKGFRYII
ncbi:unnamed protein product [Clonostachys byssicola]|uniref:Major facilitator superfamily (MFS) profile domain-containing protein n=1 Tax=Clonostachys byssicola TaxID=160290 RepID=A0A9N9Y2A6_9HYPO|nr:unnamed protein product [Clonostachys byssicola]